MRTPASARPPEWIGGSPHSPRFYWLSCACLIALAAGLRLYELSANSLWLDEASVAILTRGTFSEIWGGVSTHSAPLLHPVVLWLVQKVESSAFSVRIVPAVASVLVVAAMLLLLPRFVGRWTALQTALLFTFSTEAIRAARDAREYSIDALVAVLMIVGLLSLLRGGKNEARGLALLCVALFAAPLVQYGLVLFGCAILATVVLARLLRPSGAPRGQHASPWNETHRFHVGKLGWLFGSFAAGCCISYATSLRHQWQPGGYAANTHLADGYYQGRLADPLQALEFVVRGTWDLLASHLPLPWIVLFAVGLCIALLHLRVRFDAITVAAALAFAIAILAGLLRAYPLMGGRQAVYLVPILLLATTHATYLATSPVSKAVGWPWIVHGTMGLLAAVTVASGAIAVADGKAYAEKQGVKSVLAALQGRLQEGDAVFVARGAEPAVRFYLPTPPSNFYFSKRRWGRRNLVLTEDFVQYLVQTGLEPSNRLYIVSSHIALPDFRLLALFYEGVEVERLVEAKGSTNLHVLEAPRLMDKLREPANYLGLPGNPVPVIESTFDVYLTKQALIFVQEQCQLDDIEPPFFFGAWAKNADDPRHFRGYWRLDIPFIQVGMMMAHTCVALVPLPELPIDWIRVGQGTPPIWSGEAPVDQASFGILERSLNAGQAATHAGT